VTSSPTGATPTSPPSPPPTRLPRITPLAVAALVMSGVCSGWLWVEIGLRSGGADEGLVSASFVVALVLAAVVVVLAVLAWRQDRRRGGVWGIIAIAMAASDRVFLVLFTMLDRLG
jgi:hypothetical protein